MDKFIPYAQQSIDEEAIEEVTQVLRNEILTRGPKVGEFEEAVAEYCGAKYGVAFSSGTAALAGASFAAKIGPEDQVISTPISFVATVAGAAARGARPHFVDIDPQTANLSLDEVERLLQKPHSRGKPVVIPVHFGGVAVDMERLSRSALHPDTVIIEDAAHALGSCYADGTKVGGCRYADMTIFSFHPAKNITTGEGGMVMTNREDLAHALRKFRNNGVERDPSLLEGDLRGSWVYEVQAITGNFNFTDFQAALGLAQLKRLDRFVDKRQKLIDRYRARLKDEPRIKMLVEEKNNLSAYHLCVVLIDFDALGKSRQAVMEALQAEGIGTQVHYIPLYRHPYFAKWGCGRPDQFPLTESYYARALSLPLFYDLEMEEVDRIVSALKNALK